MQGPMLLRRFTGRGAWRWCRCCKRLPDEEEGGAGNGAGSRGEARRQGGPPAPTTSTSPPAGIACDSADLRAAAPHPHTHSHAGAPAAPAAPPPPPLLAFASLPHLRQAAKHEDPTLRFGLYLRGAACKVIKVYDGDSITLVWEDPHRAGRVAFANCRLYGIDAPELRGGTGGSAEKAAARRCRDLLSQSFLGELLEVDTTGATGLDKYGRPLVVLRARSGWTSDRGCERLGGMTLNDWILARLPGVVPYFGGTKAQHGAVIPPSGPS